MPGGAVPGAELQAEASRPQALLVDTSAWIEFLRGTGSPSCAVVRGPLASDAPLLSCDAVVMEVLAGARTDAHLRQLRGLLARTRRITTVESDWETASQLYRLGRSRGLTVRKLVGCLIGAVALRAGAPVLHLDSDFDTLASISGLVARRE